MKSARKVATRRAITRRAAPLSLTMRVERLEKAVLFKDAAPAPVDPAAPFVNLDANGKPTAGDHVAVYQRETGLTWTAAPLLGGKDLTHAEAMKAAADLDLLGKKDWRAPTVKELLSLIDYERCEPAADPKHFKGPYSHTWSSTIAKSPAGCAWVVVLGYGFSFRYRRGYHFHALAVRAGQQLGLSV